MEIMYIGIVESDKNKGCRIVAVEKNEIKCMSVMESYMWNEIFDGRTLESLNKIEFVAYSDWEYDIETESSNMYFAYRENRCEIRYQLSVHEVEIKDGNNQ